MAKASDYMLDTDVECERLERQAALHGKERILDHIKLSPGQRLLDAGCGSGWQVRFLASRFPQAEFVGIDINPKYIEFARSRAVEEGLTNLTFVVGDLEALPFPQGSFDVVWSQFVLNVARNSEAILDQLVKVTKNGGRVVAAVHDRTGLMNYPEDPALQARREKMTTAIMRNWRSEAMPSMFAKAGLDNLDLKIELDTIHSKIYGPIDPARRRNREEVLKKPLESLAHVLGGPEAAQQYLTDVLAYADRPDTTSITTYWVAQGTVS
jgi:SAM-dependent methyltransferase